MKRLERNETHSEWLRLGLIGWPVSHSHSPEIHQAAMREFNIRGEYKLYPVPPMPEGEAALDQLISEMREGGLHGLNVTIPHKQAVDNILDELTNEAREIGAVNTIVSRQGSLIGENTDASGFLADLERVFPWELTRDFERKLGNHPHALVLGAGGAARAVVYGLFSSGWSVTVAARRIEQAECLISSFHEREGCGSLDTVHLSAPELSNIKIGVALVVNATPLGMSPDMDSSPWPEKLPLPPAAAVYDLVYNPTETRLMCAAREAGLPTANGMGMLVEQAALAFECWTGLSPSRNMLLEQVVKSEV